MTELKQIIQQAIRSTVATEGAPALLGKSDGTVYYTDPSAVVHKNRVWVRIGEGDNPVEVVAITTGMPNQPGLPILVANRGGVPTVLRIDAYRVGNFDATYSATVPEHAFTHDRYGSDPIYITGCAFLPLMAHPSPSYDMTVVVEAGFYRYLATEKVFSTTATSSLASYRPATSLQTFVVLSLNRSTNALAVTTSGVTGIAATAIPFTAAQVLTVVATLADEHWPLAAIRLFGTQTKILPTDIFMDLRLWGGEYVGSVPATLNDLTDVTLSAPATNNILVYNGSQWVNSMPSATFADGIITPVVDSALQDNTNGTLFPEATGAGTIPTGWVQVDAPASTRLDAPLGYWAIEGSAGELAWEFKRQTAYNFESVVASNAYKSYWAGPIILKDGLYTQDVDYYLGIYADNSGAPNANKFVRLHIHYDQATDVWRARGQYKDGTTLTSGTYYDLARMPLQPFWLRLALKNDTNKAATVYTGATPFQAAHTPLLSGNASSSVTWGQAWWNFSMARGTGNNDTLIIGGLDYSADS